MDEYGIIVKTYRDRVKGEGKYVGKGMSDIEIVDALKKIQEVLILLKYKFDHSTDDVEKSDLAKQSDLMFKFKKELLDQQKKEKKVSWYDTVQNVFGSISYYLNFPQSFITNLFSSTASGFVKFLDNVFTHRRDNAHFETMASNPNVEEYSMTKEHDGKTVRSMRKYRNNHLDVRESSWNKESYQDRLLLSHPDSNFVPNEFE